MLFFAWLSTATATASGLQCWQPEQTLAPGQNRTLTLTRALPPHPRLRVNNKQLVALNRTIQTDSTAKAYLDGLILYGETFLVLPNSCSGGLRTRATLTMQYTLGLLWRLTGDERFAARATQELLHVTTNCSNWDVGAGDAHARRRAHTHSRTHARMRTRIHAHASTPTRRSAQ